MKDIFWHSLGEKEVLEITNSTKEGLTSLEASKRLDVDGKNTLPKPRKKGIITMFFLQLKDPIIYILLVAFILSIILGELVDAFFILFIILIDASLGTIQEWRSSKSAEALQDLMKVEALIIRDNTKMVIDAALLVVGDIVFLESGTMVPADMRLLSSHNLAIDEAVLTGESIATNKISKKLGDNVLLSDRINMAYVGTSVTRGRGIGVVVATGVNTEIGKIAKDVILKEDTKSPLAIRMEKFTKQISYIIAIIALVLIFILYFKGYAPREIFFLVVALAVSAIPEGLPVALTLSLSVASRKMATKNVLVKKLNAVESLGSCTVIASDKTGTLTLNEQTAKIILLPSNYECQITGRGYNSIGKVKVDANNKKEITEIIKLGYINNEANLEEINKEWISYGDSIDIAFLALGRKISLKDDIKEKIVGTIPYESVQKYSLVFFEDKEIYCTMKGSVEKVLDFCTKQELSGKTVKIDKEKIIKQNEYLADSGYRVIAIAKGIKKGFKFKEDYSDEDIPNLTFLGLVGFVDPIREDVISAIKKCQTAGIKTVMITGDHPLTAYHVAKELQMINTIDEVTNGEEIDKYLMESEDMFDAFISTKRVFSRVSPSQKEIIVTSYKRQGEFIAVTGDGVNDAPAMKAANVGIAMGSGTDVAKETGSMIITDDNFSSIVNGIEEGRNAYNNVRKVVSMLLSCGVCEILFFVLAIILNYDVPLLAIQLLWLNLVTDGIQDALLSFEKGEKDIMLLPPRSPDEKLFNNLLIKEVLIAGITMGIIIMSTWIFLIKVLAVDITTARSYIMLLMVLLQNFHTFNSRSEKMSLFKIPLRNNPLLICGVIFVLIIQLIVSESNILSNVLDAVKIPIGDVIKLILLALPIIIVMETFKYIERNRSNRHDN